MTTRVILLGFFLVFISISCETNNTKQENRLTSVSSDIKTDKQLNISILIDLSDRLVQPLTPSQKERDLAIVDNLVHHFKFVTNDQGAFDAKGRIKVFFSPEPPYSNIIELSNKLEVDLSQYSVKNISEKKEIYKSVQEDFRSSLSAVYDSVISSGDWQGANLWRFMKHDVQDFCIANDSAYRNILVVLTDGYVYHEQSTDRIDNKTAFITPKFLGSEGFRENNDWESKFVNEGYGLIEVGQDLPSLEVLVLEINPTETHINDMDILNRYLKDWFNEMNVKKVEVYQTSLPTNTKTRIESFIVNGNKTM